MKGHSDAFPSTHPPPPPSHQHSTSQFLICPLRPALWPLSPPELSLPLLLCDIQWWAGHHYNFLTPGYSPHFPLPPLSLSLFSLTHAAALFISLFLFLFPVYSSIHTDTSSLCVVQALYLFFLPAAVYIMHCVLYIFCHSNLRCQCQHYLWLWCVQRVSAVYQPTEQLIKYRRHH